MLTTLNPTSESRGAQSLHLGDPSLWRAQCFLAGAWQCADSGATFDVRNPATGKVLASVPQMGALETRRAIQAADRSWKAWRSQPAERAQPSCAAGTS